MYINLIPKTTISLTKRQVYAYDELASKKR